MALRFFCTYQSWSGDASVLTDDDGNILTDDDGNPLTDEGLEFGIGIFDSDFSGDPIEFRVAGGVKIDYRAEGDSILSPILASSIRFDMMIQDADHEDLITDMAAGKEGRFTVTIERNGEFYWAGVINSPEISIEDADYPFAFTITAVDGLALLKNYPYSQSNTRWADVYEAQSKLITIISRCLKKLPHVVEHFDGLDPFLVTAVNWYSTEMPDPVTATDDPFWGIWLDNRAFATGQSSGAAKFLSCYEAIANILRCFNARIALFDGYFLIEQLETRAFTMGSGANFVRSYDYDLTAPTAFSLTAQQDIGRGDPIKKLRGGTYSFIPALRAVRASQSVNALQNLIPATSFGSDNPGATYAVGWVYGDGVRTYLRFTGTFEWVTENLAVDPEGQYFGVFDLSIEIGGKWAQVNTVIDNPVTFFDLTDFTWENSESFIRVRFPVDFEIVGEKQNGATAIDFSLKLSDDFEYGDLVVGLDLLSIIQYDPSAVATVDPADYVFTWVFKDAYANIQQVTLPFVAKSVIYEVQGDAENTQVEETSSTIGDRVGTVVNQWGGLLYFDDPNYVYTTDWGARAGTRNRPITQLLAQRIISGQYFPRKVLRGTAVGNSLAVQVPVTEGTDTYILKNGTYDTEKDELNGEWVRNAYTVAELTYLDPEYDTGNYEANSPGGGTSGNGTPTNNGTGVGTTGNGTTPPGTGGIYGDSGTVPPSVAATITDTFTIGTNSADPGDSVTISIDDGSNSNVIKAEAGSGILLQSTSENIIFEGQTCFGDVLNVAAFGASQNNLAALDGANVGLLSASTAINITGIDSGIAGRILFVFNRDTNPITFTDADTNSAAENRFDSGRPYVLRNKRGAVLMYDEAADRWFVAAMGDLSYFNEAYTTSTATTASLTADTPATNVNIAIVPKGSSGSFLLDIPDGTTTGGNARGARTIDLQMSRGAADEVTSGSNSVAIGRNNKASGSGAIAIGTRATVGNVASGSNAIIIGGDSVSSNTQTIVVGNDCTASGVRSIVMGTESISSQADAVAIGYQAGTTIQRQISYASGYFAAAGDAQGSMIVVKADITGTAQTALEANGAINIDANRIVNFRVDVVGICTDGGDGTTVAGDAWASWHVGVIKRIGTATSIVGTVQTPATAQADTSMNDAVVTIDADDTNETLRIRITPPTSAGSTTDTRWVATVHLTEMAFTITG